MKISRFINKECISFSFTFSWNYDVEIEIDFLYWRLQFIIVKKGKTNAIH